MSRIRTEDQRYKRHIYRGLNIANSIIKVGSISDDNLRDLIEDSAGYKNIYSKARAEEFLVHKDTVSFSILEHDLDCFPNEDLVKGSLQDHENIQIAIDDLLFNFKDHVVFNCIMVLLPIGGIIRYHMDRGIFLDNTRRFHLPVISSGVVFKTTDGIYEMKTGFWYELKNKRYHAVENRGNIDRLHLIVDLYKKEETI